MGSEKSGQRLSVGAHVVGDGGVEVDPTQGALAEVQLDRQLRPNAHGPGLRHVVGPPLLVSQTRHRHHVDAAQRFRAGTFAEAILDLIEAPYQVANACSGLDLALPLQRRDAHLVEPRYGVAGHLDDGLQGVVEGSWLVDGPRGFGDRLSKLRSSVHVHVGLVRVERPEGTQRGARTGRCRPPGGSEVNRAWELLPPYTSVCRRLGESPSWSGYRPRWA